MNSDLSNCKCPYSICSPAWLQSAVLISEAVCLRRDKRRAGSHQIAEALGTFSFERIQQISPEHFVCCANTNDPMWGSIIGRIENPRVGGSIPPPGTIHDHQNT
jgi:hypothetical protein